MNPFAARAFTSRSSGMTGRGPGEPGDLPDLGGLGDMGDMGTVGDMARRGASALEGAWGAPCCSGYAQGDLNANDTACRYPGSPDSRTALRRSHSCVTG